MYCYRLILALLILLPVQPLWSEDAIPCQDCPTLTQIPYPQTGFWYHPERSGEGFNVELQNGALGITWFGYDRQGEPVWYLLDGQLRPQPEDPAVQWVFDADALSFSGGACLGCAFRAPAEPEVVAQVRIEFLQRGLARYRVDGSEWTTIWPLTFGSAAERVFPSTEYPMADTSGNWMFVFHDEPRADREDPGSEQSSAAHRDAYVFRLEVSRWGSYQRSWPRWSAAASIPIVTEYTGFGLLECGTPPSGPACHFEQILDRYTNTISPPKRYHVPLASLGARRIHGEAEDGATFAGYRVGYD